MATLSPTPMNSNTFENAHRPSLRLVDRQQPGSILKDRRTFPSRPLSFSTSQHMGDSSDEELPAPIMFSALTNALLNHESDAVDNPSTGDRAMPDRQTNHERIEPALASRRASPLLRHSRILASRQASEEVREGSPAPKRIVRLSAGSSGSVYRRTVRSASRDRFGSSTPASSSRYTSSQNASDGQSNEEAGGSNSPLDTDVRDISAYPSTVSRPTTANGQGSITRYATSKINRAKVEDHAVQSAVRVKRVGKVSGGFLSGPARRGRRRQSEEDQSPEPASHDVPREPLYSQALEAPAPYSPDRSAFETAQEVQQMPLASTFSAPRPRLLEKRQSIVEHQPYNPEDLMAALDLTKDSPVPVFRLSGPPPALPSARDQENEPPPTFKRNKSSGLPLMEHVAQEAEKEIKSAAVPTSPSRKVLAVRSQNTPLRAAPPPPKMSALESAKPSSTRQTATKKRRTYVTINSKIFNRMDLIGRGGSSRVYRVMAENYEVFALKKVTLEDADPLTIRGYKGEIDLLRKLGGVERVVKLIDYEINDEKQVLSVLMEIGESDLNEILKNRLNVDHAKFDTCFARHYWKEMLECVQAVHKYDIVHSDLKPANFLLVQGRLKLIDFGIANAIQDDTINVHREQQVGTPNYMSPEAIVDLNAKSGLPASSGRLMKLGKPSDVWSLGCILYQMVYGRPPFAQIQNPINRIMAIANKAYAIEYPTLGVGSMPVPPELIETLKGCLERDQLHRPTIDQLLDADDSFLYPKTAVSDALIVSEALLRRVMLNVATHCQTKGIPSDADIGGWSSSIYAKLRDHGANLAQK
ncbi:MAG: Dual-specificity kinase, spindle pole body (SPB) duplication and spindle checkpoint function [Vezdaea aestivalis]|nr:MAG: Dual-specificity kinase, spindle pole body (SPB) duplication and spindle checkpoint function [Vezdaea aestivalis]